MEEKNLITLPNKVADYLESMKEKEYSLMGAFARIDVNVIEKEFMTKFFNTIANQEKFALAWINGYKREEKFYMVKLKHFREADAYLNFDEDANVFFFSGMDEVIGYRIKFTKKFLEDNYISWVLDSEGVEIIEVEND